MQCVGAEGGGREGGGAITQVLEGLDEGAKDFLPLHFFFIASFILRCWRRAF